MRAYKIFRIRKDGSIGTLFIDKRARLEIGQWYRAKDLPTKGFAHRPGWHSCSSLSAPILENTRTARRENRWWFEVEIKEATPNPRPLKQGGMCYISPWIRIVRRVKPAYEA